MKNPPWEIHLGGLWDVFRCQTPSRLRERIEDGVDGACDLCGRFILARLDLASDAVDEVLADVGVLAGEPCGCGARGVGNINGVLASLDASGCGLAILPFVASGSSADGLSTMGLVSALDSSYLCHMSHSISYSISRPKRNLCRTRNSHRTSANQHSLRTGYSTTRPTIWNPQRTTSCGWLLPF